MRSTNRAQILVKEPDNRTIAKTDTFRVNAGFTDRMRRIKVRARACAVCVCVPCVCVCAVCRAHACECVRACGTQHAAHSSAAAALL